MISEPALLFDLDGTLEASGIDLAVWRIYRRIGMSLPRRLRRARVAR